jgi:hypothetical protein
MIASLSTFVSLIYTVANGVPYAALTNKKKSFAASDTHYRMFQIRCTKLQDIVT